MTCSSKDGNEVPDGDIEADTDVDVDSAGDADVDDVVECVFSSEFADLFDRSCSEADDCAVGFCAVDCCGTRMAVGISRAEESIGAYCLGLTANRIVVAGSGGGCGTAGPLPGVSALPPAAAGVGT